MWDSSWWTLLDGVLLGWNAALLAYGYQGPGAWWPWCALGLVIIAEVLRRIPETPR